ncbi:MAG: restriction endonuclease subunit S [Actinomycetaceae bacterium]|nr:restriction endonuclease subunit S [Actinomycetaceae bacterium]
MNSIFQKGSLSDIALVTMGQSPKKQFVSPNKIGLPLLNGPTEFGNSHPTPVQWSSSFSKTAEVGDILFCVRGSTTGRMNWADQRYAIGRGIASIRPITPEERHFVRGAIKILLPELLAATTGSTFPNISRTQLSDLPLPLPPALERVEISKLLAALDDKIESNERATHQLTLLERAYWEKWCEGNERTELFTKHFTPHLGGTPKRSNLADWNGNISWASVRDMSGAIHGILVETADKISESAARRSKRFHPLPEGSVFLTARGTVGKVVVNAMPCAINQSAYAFRSGTYGSVVTRLVVEDLVTELRSRAHGSTFNAITSADMTGLRIPSLSQNGFENLRNKLDLVEKRRIQSVRETQVLKTLRDALLPELMSGRIRVPEAREAVVDAIGGE